jgi:hypothetical protein
MLAAGVVLVFGFTARSQVGALVAVRTLRFPLARPDDGCFHFGNVCFNNWLKRATVDLLHCYGHLMNCAAGFVLNLVVPGVLYRHDQFVKKICTNVTQ